MGASEAEGGGVIDAFYEDFASRAAAACPNGTRAEVRAFIDQAGFFCDDQPEFVDYVLDELGRAGRVETIVSDLLN